MMAAVAVSCSNDSVTEVNQSGAIDFRIAATRAEALTLDALDAFKATALNDNGEPYFEALNFERNENNQYKSSTSYFWPDYDLHFYAYAPASLEPEYSGTTFSLKYTPSSSIDKQEDVVAAYASGNKDSSDTGVALEMHHLLSQIGVTAFNNNGAYTYSVKGVKIANVSTSGTLTGDKGEWSWDPSETTGSYVVEFDDAVELGAEATDLLSTTGNAMIVPQEVSPWLDENGAVANAAGAYIGLLVNIKTSAGTVVYPTDGTNYAWIATSIPAGEWLNEFHYTYNLDLTYSAGYPEPTPPNPDDDDDDDDDENPKPIMGNTIQVKVSVGSFGNTSSPDLSADADAE